MNLTDAKVLFETLRKDPSRIVVRRHAWADYPERRFTPAEIRTLVMGCNGGALKDNKSAAAQPGSFLMFCKDSDGEDVKFVVTFDKDENGDLIAVISAYREP